MSDTSSSLGDIFSEFNDENQNGEEVLITRRQLAMNLGVHPGTVVKWERSGLPIKKRGDRGIASLYSEIEVKAWLKAHGLKDTSKAATPLDLAGTRAHKEHWLALIAEQKYLVQTRKLIPISEVEDAWSFQVAAVRAKLLALPQTLSDRVFRAAKTDGLPGVEKVIADAVEDTLLELSDTKTLPEPTEPNKPKKKNSRENDDEDTEEDEEDEEEEDDE